MFDGKKYKKQWAKDNPRSIIKARRRWREKNKKHIKKYNKQYQISKYKIDLKFNLNRKISKAIRESLKGNKGGRHWETLVNYTLNDLMKRLKKTMPEGYDWSDCLQGKLHIDHKIPIVVFNYTKPEHTDFQRCWALKNLQLLPAKENKVKYNKLSRSFQPALQI